MYSIYLVRNSSGISVATTPAALIQRNHIAYIPRYLSSSLTWQGVKITFLESIKYTVSQTHQLPGPNERLRGSANRGPTKGSQLYDNDLTKHASASSYLQSYCSLPVASSAQQCHSHLTTRKSQNSPYKYLHVHTMISI